MAASAGQPAFGMSAQLPPGAYVQQGMCAPSRPQDAQLQHCAPASVTGQQALGMSAQLSPGTSVQPGLHAPMGLQDAQYTQHYVYVAPPLQQALGLPPHYAHDGVDSRVQGIKYQM